MLIEDSGSLRTWLIAELANSTEADPELVAKYTVALLKKEGAAEELRPSICSDLSIFVTENTDAFVDKLLQVVKDKSYIQPPEEVKEQAETTQQETTNVTSQAQDTTDEASISRQESKTNDTDDELSDDDRDHRRKNRRSKSGSPHQQSRHRPSPHRSICCVHRLGSNRGASGGYRDGAGYQPRGMRRGGSARSRLGRAGYHNNNYNNYNNDYNRRYENNGGPPPARSPPRRRSRSPRRSLSPHIRRRSRSPRGRSQSPHISLSPKPRARSPLDLRALASGKQRCRDYDEKGFCLMGEHCPYSHGSDAVVMTDVTSIKTLAPATSQSLTAALAAVPPQPATRPPTAAPIQPIVPAVQAPVEPYNPEMPSRWPPPMVHVNRPPPRMPIGGPAGFMGPRGPIPHYHTMQQPQHLPRHPGMPRGPHMRPMGPNHQMGYRPRHPGVHPQRMANINHPPINDLNKATLEVKNLPEEFNTIIKLNEHFSKFGTIVNLRVQHNGQIDTALVTFSTNQEAKSAYHNPEPLFNNRFIKLFWHKELEGASTSQNAPGGAVSRPNAKSRLGGDLNPPGPQPAKKPRVEPNMNPATLRIDRSAMNNSHSLNGGSVSREQRTVSDVDKQIQAMIIEMINQNKILMGRIEKSKNREEVSEMKELVRQTYNNIDKLKKDLSQPRQATKKVETEKHLLDKELDIHQKNQAGEDTATLERELDDLMQKAHKMGIIKHRGRGRGRGRGSSTARGTQPQAHIPEQTALSVTGFAPEDKDEVMAHFGMFGECKLKEYNEKTKTLVVNYTKANDCKVAACHANKYNEKKALLILKWYKPPVAAAKAEVKPAAATVLAAATVSVKPTTPAAAVGGAAAAPTVSTSKSVKPTLSSQPAKPAAAAAVVVKAVKAESITASSKELARPASKSTSLDDLDEDLLADADGNDGGDMDEALLLGEEEDDDDNKRSW